MPYFDDWAAKILSGMCDTTTPTGCVSIYLEQNVGLLNANLGTAYEVIDGAIDPLPNMIESGIYTEMYICYALRRDSIKNLAAASCDWIEIEGQNQGRVRKASRHEFSRTLNSLYKDCSDRLDTLFKWYKKRQLLPAQHTFNYRNSLHADTSWTCGCPSYYWSDCNFIIAEDGWY